MITCKTNDFAFFRADVKVRFQLNANKFAIGALIANYHPVPTLSDSVTDDINLTTTTCYPYAIIEASAATSVELTIPFTYNNASWDMINDQAIPWANFELTVMNQLKITQGSASVEVRVWVWCENISLDVPVPNKVTPFTPTRYVAKSESHKAATSGSIVGIAKKVGNAISDFGEIGSSVLDGIGSAENWMKDLGSMEMLGFCKPSNLSSKIDVTQTPSKGMGSFNGDDNSVMLGANLKNSLTNNNELFGFDVDQMNISYVCSNPCFLETFNWSTSQVTGTVLASWPVCPGLCAEGTATSNLSPGHMAYIASMFNLWRGDISYKFHVIANAFYSGRLGLVYLPRKTSIAGSVAFQDIDAAVQAVIDVRDSSVTEYTAKWAVNEPWLRSFVASRTSVGSGFTYAGLANQNVCSGLLFCYVVTPLVAPESVPTSIYVNVFTYGAPSLQFAVPLCERYCPMVSAPRSEANQRRPWLMLPKDNPRKKKVLPRRMKRITGFVAQMDQTPANVQSDPGPKGSHITPIKGKTTSLDHEICAVTIGEVVPNLRLLTRCFSESHNVTITTGDTDWLALDPAWFGWDTDDVFNPRYYRIARMYTYWRGSMRWKVLPQIPETVNYPTMLATTDYIGTNPANPPSVISYTQTGLGFPWFINVQQTPVIELATPFYSRNLLSIVNEAGAQDRQRLLVTQTFGEEVPVTVYSATGDDFSFGFLKAPPRLQLYIT